jgi:hypothetical protein
MLLIVLLMVVDLGGILQMIIESLNVDNLDINTLKTKLEGGYRILLVTTTYILIFKSG